MTILQDPQVAFLRQEGRRWSTNSDFETPSPRCYGARRSTIRTQVPIQGWPSKKTDPANESGLPIPGPNRQSMDSGKLVVESMLRSCFGAEDPRKCRSLPDSFHARGSGITGACKNGSHLLPRGRVALGRSNLSPTNKDMRRPEPWNQQPPPKETPKQRSPCSRGESRPSSSPIGKSRGQTLPDVFAKPAAKKNFLDIIANSPKGSSSSSPPQRPSTSHGAPQTPRPSKPPRLSIDIPNDESAPPTPVHGAFSLGSDANGAENKWTPVNEARSHWSTVRHELVETFDDRPKQPDFVWYERGLKKVRFSTLLQLRKHFDAMFSDEDGLVSYNELDGSWAQAFNALTTRDVTKMKTKLSNRINCCPGRIDTSEEDERDIRIAANVFNFTDLLRFNFFSCDYQEILEMAKLVAPERVAFESLTRRQVAKATRLFKDMDKGGT